MTLKPWFARIVIFHVATLNVCFLSFRKFQEIDFQECCICYIEEIVIIRRNEPACSSNLKLHSKGMWRCSQSFSFFPFFVPSSLVKKVKSKNPPCLVSFGSFLAVYWFYWQVHHFGSKNLAKSKNSPVLVTWPPHGQDGFLEKAILLNSNSVKFWSSTI